MMQVLEHGIAKIRAKPDTKDLHMHVSGLSVHMARVCSRTLSQVNMLTEWVIPEFGEFECDYVTSH